MGEAPQRPRPDRHPGWIADVPRAGKPLTFGNLEEAVPGASSPADFRDWVDAQFDPSVTWEDIAWVRSNWDGQLVVKGVLDPEDARRAADVGVDGVIVSNHGGRQLDSVPSTTLALPPIVEAIGDEVRGARRRRRAHGTGRGQDAGARRPGGARGQRVGVGGGRATARRACGTCWSVLRADIDTALGLTARSSVGDLDASALYGQPFRERDPRA